MEITIIIYIFILLFVLLSGWYYHSNKITEKFNNYIFYKQLPNSFYNQQHYPNMKLEPHVIGCGARNTPCIGGTQIPIANPLPPIDISETNIAPITTQFNKPNTIIQIGLLYKIFGNFNQYIPLYFNEYNKQYFIYYHNKKMILPNKEYGINDEITIDKHKYRFTIYK